MEKKRIAKAKMKQEMSILEARRAKLSNEETNEGVVCLQTCCT